MTWKWPERKINVEKLFKGFKNFQKDKRVQTYSLYYIQILSKFGYFLSIFFYVKREEISERKG